VFLLDEPLSGLDAKLRIETRSYIKRLHGELGATIVYVTHNHIEAQAIGNKIVMLHNNRVQQVGTPDQIYNQPANIFVAEYLGVPPINLLEATAEIEGDRVRIRHAGYSWLLPPPIAARVKANLQGREVTLGIRAEDIGLYRDAGEGRVPATVYVTEPQGHEIVVDLSFESTILRARQDREEGIGEQLEINEQVYMGFNLSRIHIFDRTSGVCVSSEKN
jgi:multiple sugar transport system ATP-binding protein